MKAYRILFETVYQDRLKLYMNADPWYFRNVSQTVCNSQIPDEHWYATVSESDNPWDQYLTLRKWASEDAHFVRNVRLERLVSEPVYEVVTDEEMIRLNAEA